ncbi:MAG: hypothetical protein ACREBG_10765 [Pyrinomonadaceae bacterium]
MNLHCKDTDGNHRILHDGLIEDVDFQTRTKRMLRGLNIKADGPVLGFLRGGKYAEPPSKWMPPCTPDDAA